MKLYIPALGLLAKKRQNRTMVGLGGKKHTGGFFKGGFLFGEDFWWEGTTSILSREGLVLSSQGQARATINVDLSVGEKG